MGTPSAKLVVRKTLKVNFLIFSPVFSHVPCPNGEVEPNGESPAKKLHFLFLHSELGFLIRSLTGERRKKISKLGTASKRYSAGWESQKVPSCSHMPCAVVAMGIMGIMACGGMQAGQGFPHQGLHSQEPVTEFCTHTHTEKRKKKKRIWIPETMGLDLPGAAPFKFTFSLQLFNQNLAVRLEATGSTSQGHHWLAKKKSIYIGFSLFFFF